MVPLGQLLIPIALSALLVLVASALVWLVLPHHRRDMRRLPDEAASLEALGKQALRPGVYRFPYASDGWACYYPLARTVMGGLISSTVLTLVVLPYINHGIENAATWARRVWAGSAPRTAAEPVS